MFAEIRAACAEVARRARHVRIVDPEGYARGLGLEHAPPPAWDEVHHFRDPADTEATAAFVLTLDSVNFGSGYFPHLAKRPGMSGYFTVASRLRDRFVAAGPPTAAELERMGVEDAAVLFGQPLGQDPVRDELTGLFARALRELGGFVRARAGGSFVRLVRDAGGRGERLAETLAGMPLFRDVHPYDGLEVPLYKRAQIAVSDLALAFGGAGPGSFADLDRLTIFADNLVPHVLRLDGVLVYEAGLAARLARGELLPSGSAEEVELRACAVHAVERMAAALREDGVAASARELDVLLWERGQAARYRGGEKHRTRTVFY